MTGRNIPRSGGLNRFSARRAVVRSLAILIFLFAGPSLAAPPAKAAAVTKVYKILPASTVSFTAKITGGSFVAKSGKVSGAVHYTEIALSRKELIPTFMRDRTEPSIPRVAGQTELSAMTQLHIVY